MGMRRWFARREQEPVWLIVGLGNPETEYHGTRHNIGFDCVNAIAARHNLDFRSKRAKADIAEGRIVEQRVTLAKPFTFMNRSGQAVVGLRNWYKVDLATHLLVIYDDLDLPFGTLRLRQKGGPGTHNGMKSVIGLLGSQSFPRIRVGIGAPPPRWDVSSYVLGKFTAEERDQLPALIERAADAVDTILREDFTTAMNRFNAMK
jgi:PTH1 family peptidyl-tRNA hydrolase